MKELLEKIESLKIELAASHARNIDMFENEESDGYDSRLMKFYFKTWDLEDVNHEGFIDIADETKEFKNNNSWYPFLEGCIIASAETDYANAYVDEIAFEFRWKEPDDDAYRQEVDKQVREEVSKYFDIPTYRLSCSSIDLLLDGKIDEDTFKELNKGHC